MRNKTTTLTHFLTRDAPLIAMEAWYKGRMHKFKEYTGIKYHMTLFMHKNGVFRFYTDLNGFNEVLPQNLSKWILPNEDKFMKINEIMHESLIKIKEIITSSVHKKKGLVNALEKIADFWSDGYIGVLISHHLPIFHRKFMQKGIRLFENRIVKEAIFWRQKEGNIYFNEGVEAINHILNKISRIKKCNKEILNHMTLKEIRNYIEGNILPNDILQRENSLYLYLMERVVNSDEIGPLLKKLRIKLSEEGTGEGISEFKGQIANKGKVRGVTRIITKRSDLKKFRKNDIIVAHMTSPWYIPILQSASAIITDEGGVTCHAAIISREMKKPCIVGTRIATEVLSDGILVEVDANKGIIRKIND